MAIVVCVLFINSGVYTVRMLEVLSYSAAILRVYFWVLVVLGAGIPV